MALCSLRLRRTLTTLATLRRSLSSSLMISSQTTALSSFFSPSPSSSVSCESSTGFVLFHQFRAFRSSPTLLLSSWSSRKSDFNAEEIGPDTILFEGCDYNHWLIVMDFGKDNENKPPPEEMVRIYEETCAKGLNISVEEAKKKMYACSTTTYTGFQVEMTEEESEKFNGLDRVIFVLPDSYINPAEKEYGGDKYVNGTIIHRPPPIQYGRMGPRNRDRNRNPEQSRYQGPSFNYQQGSGSNFGPSQNHPQRQNYNPASQNSQPLPNSGQGSQFDNPQQNYRPGQQNYGPPSQSYQPQPNHGPPPQSNQPQPNHGLPSQSYQPQQNYGPPPQSNQPQPNRGPPSQSYQPQQNYGLPSRSYQPQQNYGPPSQSYQPQENYAKPSPNDHPQQKYGQTSQSYVPQQNNVHARDDLRDYPSQGATGTYRPGTQTGGAQNHSWNGEAQRFPQGQERNIQGDQRNYSPAGQTDDPVRY